MKTKTKTYAYALDLTDDQEVIKQYVEHHKNVPPEVLEAGKALGILSDRIYLIGNRLFRFTEATDGYDPDTSCDYARLSSVARKWDELMRTYQRPLEQRESDEWWARMELIYQCDFTGQ